MKIIDVNSEEGNIFAIFGQVIKIIKKHSNNPERELKEFKESLPTRTYYEHLDYIEKTYGEYISFKNR